MTPSDPTEAASVSPTERNADANPSSVDQQGTVSVQGTAATPGAPTPGELTPRTRTSAAWIGIVVGALVLALVIVFIAQNEHSTRVHFLGWHFSFEVGLLILASAVAGALIVVLVGAARLLQLRLTARRHRRRVAAATSAQ